MRVDVALLLVLVIVSGSVGTVHALPEDVNEQTLPTEPHDMSRDSIKLAFSSLDFIEMNQIVVAYNGKTAKLINKKRSSLDRSHPLFVDEDFEADDILLMQTRLSETDSQAFYILFTEGPSLDPSFYFIKSGSPDKVWDMLPGTAIAIPGNGAVYVANRHNDTFTRRTKYLYATTALIEVPQPYYYVGLKTRTLKPISLYISPDEKQTVAQLPKGSEIEVVLADTRLKKQNKTCFLIKTPFGLLGWSWIPDEQYVSDTVDGISFWGD